jgi:hypothetical protein
MTGSSAGDHSGEKFFQLVERTDPSTLRDALFHIFAKALAPERKAVGPSLVVTRESR